jgi:hypothetical protein
MTEPAEEISLLVSELIHEYRRLSELVRRMYLDDISEQVDIDEFGERMAHRARVVQKLFQYNQRLIVSALSDEDHLWWRLIVLRRKLQDRGATPAETVNHIEVLGLQQKLELVDERLKRLTREAGQIRKDKS